MSRLVRLDRLESSARTFASPASSLPHTTDEPRLLHRLSERVGVLSGEGSGDWPFDERGLSVLEVLAVRAWQASLVPRAPAPTHAWDAPGFEQPVHIDPVPTTGGGGGGGAQPAPPPTPVMVGSIAIGIVMVSGPTTALRITGSEQQKIVQEVMLATDFLANAEPRARISFDYDIQPIDVRTKAGTRRSTSDPYERYEAPWRDAALRELGYGRGRSGYESYVADLARNRRTRWAYVAFFTKYKVHHFAYADGPKVVMHYANDGWGEENIHAVFAHETCHVFGAADEYGNCACNSTHGALNAPNHNCVACSGKRVECLMEKNVLRLCKHSRRQIGWGAPYLSGGSTP